MTLFVTVVLVTTELLAKLLFATPTRKSSENNMNLENLLHKQNFLFMNVKQGKACKHGGVCMNVAVYPFEMYCDCVGTGYHGDLCEIDDCINCNENQTCTDIDLLVPDNATCECKGSG